MDELELYVAQVVYDKGFPHPIQRRYHDVVRQDGP